MEAQPTFDHRAFRAGTVAGGLALIAALGAFKNFIAMFSGEREGYVLFGFLALQYSASQVWFGYAFSGLTGQLLRIPHILLYCAAAYGLWTRRKWAWYLLVGYLAYVVISLGVFTLLYPWGWLTGNPYPEPYLSSETRFFFEALAMIVVLEWFLYRQRGVFGIAENSAQHSAVSSQRE
ncbi:MAG: hypothetical protein FJ147_03485 [Deltaproteobacteria bacterium]|nr:hypothetical protein [Deltaproteobacteria bacterium]